MTIDFLALSMRMLHIMAAMTAVGGSIFLGFAYLPALPGLDDASRKELHERVRSRWAKVIGIAIGILLISGFVNYFLFMQSYKTWGDAWRAAYSKPYNILFGVKFLLALGMFFLASALAGKAPGLQKIRDKASFWITVNLLLAFAIVVISGIMRQTHFGPTAPTGYKSILVEESAVPAVPATSPTPETPAQVDAPTLP